MKDKLYVVTYTSECGDEGVAGVFTEEPTDGHLAAITRRDYSDHIVEDDYEDGPRRLIFFDIHKAVVEELPEPIDPIPSI